MEHLHYDDQHDWGFITGHDRVHHAVILIEGFDNEGTAHVTDKGWSASVTAMDAGRFSGFSARTTSPSTGGGAKVLPSTYATLIFGLAIKFTNISANDAFMVVRNGSGGTTSFNVSVNGASGSGKMQVKNQAGTVIATGTTNISNGVWYYVELKAFVNVGTPASGTCELRLNGAAEIASTVGNFGNLLLDRVLFANNAGGSTTYNHDDIYVCDTSGSAPNNTFLGDVRVVTIAPTSDGAHTDWTPSVAGAHWSNVDELNPPNDDTDYVSDQTPGHIDTYGFSDVDSGATVFAIQVNLYARKDDANTRQIAPVIRQSSTDYVGTTVTLSSTYTYYLQLYDKDPLGAAWTAANVNSDEYGVKEIA